MGKLDKDNLGLIQNMSGFSCQYELPKPQVVAKKKPKKRRFKNPITASTPRAIPTSSPQLKPHPEEPPTKSRANTDPAFVKVSSLKNSKSNNFLDVQREEALNPIELVAWTSDHAPSVSFENVQAQEMEDRDIEEAMILIAQMESMNLQ